MNVNHIAPEAEFYFGQWTFQGIAGVEFGNSASGQVGPNIVTYNIGTRFFDQVNLAYYLGDNLKVFLGHRFLGGRNALAIGGEWGFPLGFGRMGSMFVEGRIGEGDASGVWGGIKFYFGQKDKPLIRRNREDDPNDSWTSPGVSNPGNSNPVPMQPPKTCCPRTTELAPGTNLAENLELAGTPCCTAMLNVAPGAQLAENAGAEGTMVATSCGCVG